MDRDQMKSENTRAKRAPYKRPALRAYGPIARLTSGGSGTNLEAMVGGMNLMRLLKT